MRVEPVPETPAGVVETGNQRLLVVADYHAGIEAVLRTEGVELDSRADQRRDRIRRLVSETDPDRLVVLGDLVHAIADLWEAERTELTALFDALHIPVTLVKGNHDAEIEEFLASINHDITVTASTGKRFETVGFVHGHTWPSPKVLGADIVCIGHEHPLVRLEDTVGGSRVERIWLRGTLDTTVFETHSNDYKPSRPDLVVFPAFNNISGGTHVNIAEQQFLAPFLPEALTDGDAYLLDGTRLGGYKRV
ncbi:metallophosphoesterase [Halovenus rubra]|uniref:Metallophosphoesterase n=2 Tax=Halovenus rubra TaxID=869890 RepID=A0ACC7E5T0_9EURY|nr:metallophosphoesterase [Halovenus rubra]